MEYIIVEDESCHYYVIPVDKEEAFETWANSEDDDAYDLPDYAVPINGALSLLKFKEYRLED